MARPTPKDAFNDNIADAHRLVQLANILKNTRTKRMRSERRSKIGSALGFPKKRHDDIDGVESDDVFVVLKPGTMLTRDDFDSHPSLLRQAVVAACAALETYVSDMAEDRVREILRNRDEDWPDRLGKIPMTLSDWKKVESYKYRWRGITEVVIAPYLREESSTSASKIGQLLSLCGVEKPLRKIDTERGAPRGTTETELNALAERRNRIAHSGDRAGHGRAGIEPEEVTAMLDQVKSVSDALALTLESCSPADASSS
jgi:hypothetical protein